jgi:hypothetical protein
MGVDRPALRNAGEVARDSAWVNKSGGLPERRINMSEGQEKGMLSDHGDAGL